MNERSDKDAPAAARLLAAFPLLDAVARAGGFAAAARMLGLDPSAVSHRVRGLEADLQLTLFDRAGRQARPTRAGEILCAAAARSFEEAERALRAARDLRSSRAIRLSASSSVAMKWLLPRLPDAAAAGLELSLDVSEALAGFATGDLDAGLRFGPGPYPGLHATRLCGCALQPVAGARHPAARTAAHPASRTATGAGDRAGDGVERANARGADPLLDPKLPLLGDAGAEKSGAGATWEAYRRLRGAEAPLPNPLQRFDRADLMLQAAIGGLGVALGRSLLIEDDIRRGLLVPLGPAVPIPAAFWLVTRPERAADPGMEALRRWLREQIRLTRPV